MDVGSYGKKKGNQKEELEEQNQESYLFEKTTNSNSPDRNAIMAFEGSSNKQKGEDRQNNKKYENIDNHSKGSEKGSDDREKGGRGRGRCPLSFQDDKGGREGNHSQEIEGSNLDILCNNTTTMVLHQNDDTAQSRSDNEQELNANGKPDNVSISLQQAGAKKDATG